MAIPRLQLWRGQSGVTDRIGYHVTETSRIVAADVVKRNNRAFAVEPIRPSAELAVGSTNGSAEVCAQRATCADGTGKPFN